MSMNAYYVYCYILFSYSADLLLCVYHLLLFSEDISEEEGTKKMCPNPDMLCKGPEAYMLSDGTFDKGLFYFLAKYVKHYYGETYIKNWLANEKGKCYLSMITVDDIAYSILLIKNSAHVWRQDYYDVKADVN